MKKTTILISSYYFNILVAIGASILIVGIGMFASTAHAADLRGFQAGRIIDDAVMRDKDSMSVGDIQQFLNAKGANCYGQHPAPCLKSYMQNGKSSAQIIYDMAQLHNINPQVLIVLLQKETGLVTDSDPYGWQYRSAAGYGCPDSTPGKCESDYAGFTNQLDWAGTLFDYVMKGQWRTQYNVGDSTVFYHPDLARCGNSTVRIENRATVALYTYTPYQPNQSALNAGYGQGDSCGAYGNRNFYSYFNDWFGSTLLNSVFLRTPNDPTVYLVTPTNKYPISDVRILDAAYPLGGVGFASKSYLDSKPSAHILGRLLRSSSGTVYYFDAGIKLAFTSCAQVKDYGYDCGQAVLLTDAQLRAFSTGPNMTSVYKTTSSKKFLIKDGKKQEVYDDESLRLANIANNYNILGESAISNLSYASPIIRDDVLVKTRGTNQVSAYFERKASRFDDDTLQYTAIKKLKYQQLDRQSVAFIDSKKTISPLLENDGRYYVLTQGGKKEISDLSTWPASSFSTISEPLFNQINKEGTLTAPYFIKSPHSGSVYLLNEGKKRPISSIDDLILLADNDYPSIILMPERYVNSISDGGRIIRPGRLVKNPTDATVYMIDGLHSKIALSSFYPAIELGLTMKVEEFSSKVLEGYVTTGGMLTNRISCQDINYVGVNKTLFRSSLVSPTNLTLDKLTCQSLLSGPALPQFLLAKTGTIFYLKAEKKQPISAFGKYLQLGGNESNTILVSDYALKGFDTGPAL